MKKCITFFSTWILFYILIIDSIYIGSTGYGEQPDPDVLLPDSPYCGLSGVHERIIFGKEADIGEFPWMARLEYDTPNGRSCLCGGSLLNNRFVLTAGHCIYTGLSNVTLVNIILGEHDVRTDIDCRAGQCSDLILQIPVDKIVIHEDYDRGKGHLLNDIALIKLKEKVKFTDFVKPICLPKDENDLAFSYYRNKLYVAGWGTTETSSESNVLLKALVKPISFEDCQAKFKRSAITIKETNLCAGGDTQQDSCRGDSGGPLMSIKVNEIGDTVYNVDGIVSFGFTCGVLGWPGIYTNVINYMSWILENMKKTEMNLSRDKLSQTCITPNFENGKCIALKQCKYLMKFLLRGHIHPKVRKFLQESQCGYANNQPLVCCYIPPGLYDSSSPGPGASAGYGSSSAGHGGYGSHGSGHGGYGHHGAGHAGYGGGLNKNGSSNVPSKQRPPSTTRPLITGGQASAGYYPPAAPASSFLEIIHVSYELPSRPNCGNYSLIGTDSETNDYPWSALLLYNNTDTNTVQILCSGVLINQRFVLTAAHCIRSPNKLRLIGVRLGGYRGSKKLEVNVDFSMAYLQYDARSKENDIGILKLASDVLFTDFIMPICLPTEASYFSNVAVGKRLQLAVWKMDDPENANKIIYDIPIVPSSVCDDVLLKNKLDVLTEDQICAGGEKGNDACAGHGGAPLMYKETDSYGVTNWYAAGIVSFGASVCGKAGVPSVYTNVLSYIPWIKTIMS